MTEVPLAWSGVLTVAALVGLGVFLYPWLLKQRAGAVFVAAGTIALAVLFYFFDRRAGSEPSVWLAIAWALLPAIAGGVAFWFNKRSSSKT